MMKLLVAIRDSYFSLCGELVVDSIIYAKEYLIDDLKEYIENIYDDIHMDIEDKTEELIPLLDKICSFYSWKFDIETQ